MALPARIALLKAAARAAGPDRDTRAAAYDPGRSADEAARMHAVARRGVGGGGAPYPHANRINAAFGRYAPAALRAHFGPAAREAGERLSATAFVWNGEAAFTVPPDLHTAAHEAAHMVHQSRGAGLRHGVGVRGDAGERLADRAADRVAAGRSAEPVFEAAFAAGEARPDATPAPSPAPALQMKNEFDEGETDYDAQLATPWKEIADGLGLSTESYGNLKTRVGLASQRYGRMFELLGDNCDRAKVATVNIDGQRPNTQPRDADAMQTAFGALGSFMALVTASSPVDGRLEFEGGHLIADSILGYDSYEEFNFAPQRNHLNYPIYNVIEAIAVGGTDYTGLEEDVPERPLRTLTARVDYVAGTLNVPARTVMTQLGIRDDEVTVDADTTTLQLIHRVPWLWTATLESGRDDYAFANEGVIDPGDERDPLKRGGAAFGFLGSLQDVMDAQNETTDYADIAYWSMDTLRNNVFGRADTVRGTGKASKHVFKAVQSVPVGRRDYRDGQERDLPPTEIILPVDLVGEYRMSDIVAQPTVNNLNEFIRELRDDNDDLLGSEYTLGGLQAAAREIYNAGNEVVEEEEEDDRLERTVRRVKSITGAKRRRSLSALQLLLHNFDDDVFNPQDEAEAEEEIESESDEEVAETKTPKKKAKPRNDDSDNEGDGL